MLVLVEDCHTSRHSKDKISHRIYNKKTHYFTGGSSKHLSLCCIPYAHHLLSLRIHYFVEGSAHRCYSCCPYPPVRINKQRTSGQTRNKAYLTLIQSPTSSPHAVPCSFHHCCRCAQDTSNWLTKNQSLPHRNRIRS